MPKETFIAWLLCAVFSVAFATMTALLAKSALKGCPALAAINGTCVGVLLMAISA